MDSMRVTIANNIRIEHPSEMLHQWCRNNLVIANPDYAKKTRMSLWTGDTPRWLYLYEIDGETLVLPFGVLRSIQSLLQNSHIVTEFRADTKVEYTGTTVPLYDYQKDAVYAALKARFGIIQAKAGSGKTQMGIAIVRLIGKRTLWLTHTVDLLNQSKERAERYFSPELIGTITAGKVNIGTGITFATIQTMSKLDLPLYRDTWDTIIVDECHRVAGTPTAMTMFSKVLNNLSARHKYGLSATVHRADGLIKATYSLLGEVVYRVPDEAVADKVMKVAVQPVTTDVGISRECLNFDGTLNYTRLINYLAKHTERNKMIADTLLNDNGESFIILSDRIEQLEHLQALLPAEERRQSVLITGKMTTKAGKAERQAALQDMRDGKRKYLFATYALCKEGLDIPRLDRLYMATPVKDYAVVTQSIGRIARVFEGKGTPVVYDFVDYIPYLINAYKTRLRHYRKASCEILEEVDGNA